MCKDAANVVDVDDAKKKIEVTVDNKLGYVILDGDHDGRGRSSWDRRFLKSSNFRCTRQIKYTYY